MLDSSKRVCFWCNCQWRLVVYQSWNQKRKGIACESRRTRKNTIEEGKIREEKGGKDSWTEKVKRWNTRTIYKGRKKSKFWKITTKSAKNHSTSSQS